MDGATLMLPRLRGYFVMRFISCARLDVNASNWRRLSFIVQSLVFTSTNITMLSQLNALACMRRVDNLTINADGNPITKLSVWRPYVVFRLAHFSLKHISGSEVSNFLPLPVVVHRWRFGVVVTRRSRSSKLTYAEPG